MTQSIYQCGEEKDEESFYIYFFYLSHYSKVKFPGKIYLKSPVFLMNFIFQGMNLTADATTPFIAATNKENIHMY